MDEAKLAAALALLEEARGWAPDGEAFLRLERAASHLRKTAKARRRLERKRQAAAADRNRLASRGLPAGRPLASAHTTDATDRLRRHRSCYVCHARYREAHDYYHMLCRSCGDTCWAQREAPLDLRGRTALVTGGRVKIGFATALRMLRAGATVHVTTRFPLDAERRFAAESDAAAWGRRLFVHGIDFRNLRQLVVDIERWRAEWTLDILVNNAAQTIWHPPEHYAALRAAEGLLGPASPGWDLGLVPVQDLDLQRRNSWRLGLAEIHPVEMLEAQMVNAIAPFLLCSRLLPCFERSLHRDRYIVNVAAVEGQFGSRQKSPRHPHTNMAKAALNMLTATSASDYAARGVFMASVDPGWMSDEGPPEQRDRATERGFHPPLAAEDCAARIVHPIAAGLAGSPLWGVLLRDFRVEPW